MKRYLCFMLCALLLLGACDLGSSHSVEYNKGSEGIVVSFEGGTPPPEVYEYSVVPIQIRLSNKGSFDVPYNQIIFSLLGEPFYVLIDQDPLLQEFERENGSNWPSADNPLRKKYEYTDVGILHGRQPGYELGDFVDLHPIVDIREITGLRENPETQLYASLCYPYRTTLGTTVCVDANAFNGNQQEQVCTGQTITLQDQGAPVAIVRIENRPSPVRVDSPGGRGFRDVVQPTFVLHLKNVGTGTVLTTSPATKEELKASCSMDIPRERLNTVEVKAQLSNLNLTCDPAIVMLRNDEAYTTCTLLPQDGTVIDAPNYVGTLKVTLDYLYRDSLATDVSIIKRPEGFVEGDFTIDERDQNPGFVNGEPRCDYCSHNPNDKKCQGWPEDAAPGSYSCSCSEVQCMKLAKNEPPTCVIGQTWCPGTNHCCQG